MAAGIEAGDEVIIEDPCFVSYAPVIEACGGSVRRVPLLRDVFGLDRSHAAVYTSVSLVFLAGGALLMGWVSDKVRRRKPFIVGAAAVSASTWCARAARAAAGSTSTGTSGCSTGSDRHETIVKNGSLVEAWLQPAAAR